MHTIIKRKGGCSEKAKDKNRVRDQAITMFIATKLGEREEEEEEERPKYYGEQQEEQIQEEKNGQ